MHAEGQRSTVEVLRGQVAAGNRKSTADVDAGKGAWFTAKSKPVVAQLLPAPDLGGIQGRTWTQTAPRRRVARKPIPSWRRHRCPSGCRRPSRSGLVLTGS